MFKVRKIVLSTYICCTIIFLNFGFQILPDYQLTIAVLYPFIFLLLGHLRFRLSRLNLYFLMILFPILVGIVGYISFLETELIPFLRSYSLYYHFCFSLLIVNSVKTEPRIMETIDSAIIYGLIIITGFTLLQAGISLYLGVPFMFNPFGKYLIGGVSDVGRFELDGRIRPTGFYWEPSTNSLVIFTLINYLTIRDIEKFKRYYFLQFIVQFIINSTTGLFATVLTFIMWINNRLKKYYIIKTSFIFLLAFLFINFNFDRLAQVFNGGSGQYRWGLPMIYFCEYIKIYPLGLPLGQLIYPLDNGLFVALIYTGLIGLALTFVLFLWFITLLFKNKITITNQIFITSVLLIMIFNGAFLTPEMSFLICLIILAWKSNKTKLYSI